MWLRSPTQEGARPTPRRRRIPAPRGGVVLIMSNVGAALVLGGLFAVIVLACIVAAGS